MATLDLAGEAVAAPELELLPGRVEPPLSFAALFGRRAPVEIEIGIGKGRFILQEAELRRETDFLGLEWSLKHLRIAKERAARHGVANVRFYRADARHVLAELLPDAAVTRVHVYCPDPWPKKRHHKRRLFTPGTARHLERVLVPDGYLNVSTDVGDYFEEIVAVIGGETGLQSAEDPLQMRAGTGQTNYESKYLAQGRTIHRATWRRPHTGA